MSEPKNAGRDHTRKGWSWFDTADAQETEAVSAFDLPDPGRELRIAYARSFTGPDGEKVLQHLRTLTLERALGPDANARTLRHMEGQRQLVVYVLAQIERGRQGQ